MEIIHLGNSDILIVDDQISNLQLLTDLLEKEGYQVRPADNPQMAIDSALLKPPGLILLDVRMPGMDGFELCKNLKQDERTQDVPIVFISSLNDMEARIRAFEAGGVDFISKPFQELEVLARVKTHMRLHEMQQNLETLVKQRTSELTKSKTSLEQNIKALKESEELFRSVVEHANEVIVITQDETVKYANDKIFDLSAYTPAEICKLGFQVAVHPKDLEKVLREYRSRITGERITSNYSIRILTKNGQEKHVFVNSSMINWHGRPATLAMITDITELKQTEEELLKSEKRFRSLMDQSPLAIELLEPNGQISRINRAWRELWGVDKEEAKRGMEKYNMRTDPQLEEKGLAHLVEKAFSGQSVVLPPFQYDANRTVDDFEIDAGKGLKKPWIQSHLYSIKNTKGEIVQVVNLYLDISDLKVAELEGQRQMEALARMDRATKMGQLTGSIAHELNQPLTGILSNAQAAELMIKNRTWEADEMAEIMAEIVKDTKRGAEVIRNLQELYREQKGEYLPVNINTIVKDTIKMLHSEIILQNIKTTTKYAKFVPGVLGNVVQIQQVLVNLIMNGIEAMSENKKSARQLNIKTVYDENEISIWVRDTGIGIDADKIDRIFEPLVTWKPGGTGMGLAISNSIIAAHGGLMRAENMPGRGAQVGFILPVSKEN